MAELIAVGMRDEAYIRVGVDVEDEETVGPCLVVHHGILVVAEPSDTAVMAAGDGLLEMGLFVQGGFQCHGGILCLGADREASCSPC